MDNSSEELIFSNQSYLSYLRDNTPTLITAGPHHHATIILLLASGGTLLFSMFISCARNCWKVHSKVGAMDSLSHNSCMTRPDSVLIQSLEEEMVKQMHSDVLMALQPMAHGHETTISVKGFNGVCLESTFTEKKTAEYLDNLLAKARERESYIRYLEGKSTLADLPRLPARIRVHSRNLLRTKSLANETLRTIAHPVPNKAESDSTSTDEDEPSLITID